MHTLHSRPLTLVGAQLAASDQTASPQGETKALSDATSKSSVQLLVLLLPMPKQEQPEVPLHSWDGVLMLQMLLVITYHHSSFSFATFPRTDGMKAREAIADVQKAAMP